MKRMIVIAWLGYVMAGLAGAVVAGEKGMELVIYNEGFAMVGQVKQMRLDKGINTIRWDGLGPFIEPASISLVSLTEPNGVKTLEQSYNEDVEGMSDLLELCVGREVVLKIAGAGADTGRHIRGRLLKVSGDGYIIKREEGIELIRRNVVEGVLLDALPEGIELEPYLNCLVEVEQESESLLKLTYITGGLRWDADYRVVIGEDESNFDFSGWVVIDNKSGVGYENASVKLLAGDIHKVSSARYRDIVMMAAKLEDSGDVSERTMMEYHLYSLGRCITVNNSESKGIEFIKPVKGVSAERKYIFDRQQDPRKVLVKVEFENSEQNGLGLAMPAGKVRVFKRDSDGEQIFIGEDSIGHTPNGKKVSVSIGSAFDIVADCKLVEQKVDRRERVEKYRVELANRKKEAVVVFVDERFRDSVNWEILGSNYGYKKYDAQRARFEVPIEAESTVVVEYTTRQWW